MNIEVKPATVVIDGKTVASYDTAQSALAFRHGVEWAEKKWEKEREDSAKFAFNTGLEMGTVLGKRKEEREFVDAIINAIGEISVAEAQAAIAKWREENK